jgi:hypothetical protein
LINNFIILNLNRGGNIKMDVVQAIKERKSIRAFKPDQVPLDLLKKILEQAMRAFVGEYPALGICGGYG